MIGLGTVINSAAIIIGGFLGMIFGKFMNKKIQYSVVTAAGICTIFIGSHGAIEKMISFPDSSMMMICSIILGTVIGELFDIEYRIEQFGEWLKKKTKSSGDASFVNGFVTASVTVCVGAMAVIGSINDGISGDISILLAKSVLDFIIIIIMTASMGKGCIFSVIPVAVFQGTVTAFSKFIEPLMTEQALANLDLVGSILIFCIGVNLVWGKKIKVANMLPAIIIAAAWVIL